MRQLSLRVRVRVRVRVRRVRVRVDRTGMPTTPQPHNATVNPYSCLTVSTPIHPILGHMIVSAA